MLAESQLTQARTGHLSTDQSRDMNFAALACVSPENEHLSIYSCMLLGLGLNVLPMLCAREYTQLVQGLEEKLFARCANVEEVVCRAVHRSVSTWHDL